MEVHHHPDLHHEKKPWKEYILEGLMIFLAVTMGFFAENLRERISDNSREKEFAKALYSELRADSIAAAQKLLTRQVKVKEMDRLRNYFQDSSLTVLPPDFYPMYTRALYLLNRYSFEPKDGILSQLRNSGSLRYFKSVALQKLLGDLSVDINNMRYRNEQEYQFFASPIKPFLLQHFDFGWLSQVRSKYPYSDVDSSFVAYFKAKDQLPVQILNAGTIDRGEAANMVSFYQQLIVSTNSFQLYHYIHTNKKILGVLRKEYKIEEE
ncbi:MAG TPA: hypothetical protein VL442_05780 [Mucilaginibacter sp.]|jgi:hypothetical protein|nr:hypothetical protein [Mucilaginibacter sp.]